MNHTLNCADEDEKMNKIFAVNSATYRPLK